MSSNSPRIHRLGTVTAGLSMVGFGTLFLLHLWWDAVSYELIFSLWPLMLISLGLELLLCAAGKENVVYDKAAVVLLIVLTFFAMGMAVTDVALHQWADVLAETARHW
ncbi:MAG: hypothetical protein SPE74_00475 [Oscillospiraceae bacterium]|nr:hypothetical protein [Oscillospiraceae bacterium]